MQNKSDSYSDSTSGSKRSETRSNPALDENQEGELTKKVESATAKVPSMGYLGLAFGSMFLSASVALFTNKKSAANFIGLWVPSLMLIGIYNKIVKMEQALVENQGPTIH